MKTIIAAARRQNQVSSGAQKRAPGSEAAHRHREREATQRIRDCSSSRNVNTSKPLAVTATGNTIARVFIAGNHRPAIFFGFDTAVALVDHRQW